MTERYVEACVPVDISDDDVYEAMKDISGFLDITPGDCKEIYRKAYEHAVVRLTRSVKVADVMTRDVAFVLESAPLKGVAQIMAEKHISGVPVVSTDGKVTGVISEKDFLAAMAGGEATTFMKVVAQCLQGGACLAAPIRPKCAGDIMSSPAITVNELTSVVEVANLLARNKINRVPVVDPEGRLVGIVSRADVIRSTPFVVGS
jgi:CBS domain-containing membrane protein